MSTVEDRQPIEEVFEVLEAITDNAKKQHVVSVVSDVLWLVWV